MRILLRSFLAIVSVNCFAKYLVNSRVNSLAKSFCDFILNFVVASLVIFLANSFANFLFDSLVNLIVHSLAIPSPSTSYHARHGYM